MTRIHHLNCASFTNKLGALVGMPRNLVAHVLLIEGANGLTLVDSGYGTADVAGRTLNPLYAAAMGADFDPSEPAITQVRALGFAPEDVRDIVLTHLDADHAGALPDFPHATVHVNADEYAAAMAPRLPREHLVYYKSQWAHGPNWLTHETHGDRWLGFESAKVIADDVVMIPLRGHTKGHSGVAVRRPSGGWFLHAGDSYFGAGEKETPPRSPAGMRAFQVALAADNKARKHNQERLRELHASNGPAANAEEVVTIFSAHDKSEFDALASVTD